MNTLTNVQIATLHPIVQVSACLSFLGSLAIITTYAFVESFRRPSNRIVFLISFADLFGSITMFLARWPIDLFHQNAVCMAQGWGITFFLLSAMFWTACLSFQCLMAVKKATRIEKMETMEKWFHL
ncbi:hypothetical protein HK096_004997, partial [Nowakowskiella sp. JEL0078]